MKKILVVPLICIFSLVVSFSGCIKQDKHAVDYVNPNIGNISHMLVPTFPTVHLPNSFLRVYPKRNNLTSLNDFTGDILLGLPIIMTNHRGGYAFNLSPYQGEEKNIKPVVSYSYDNEKVTPYSYSVYLDEQQIKVKFAVSRQSAMYELAFGKDENVYLVLNSGNGALRWDGKAVSGFDLIRNKTKTYIYFVPSILPEDVFVLNENKLKANNNADGENACLVLKYTLGTSHIEIQYGISFIDEKQARENMEREVEGRDVKSLHAIAREMWNKALNKIEVTGGTKDEKAVFYTSLYRYFERPVCISENGRYYSPFDGQIHDDFGSSFYTDDWLWDSYLTHHPLRTIIEPKKEEYILNSFVLTAGQLKNFWMPKFPEITGERWGMNCNHGVVTILDAYRKGLRGFDLAKAYEACKNAITEKSLAPWSGSPAGILDKYYKTHGFIPGLREGEEEPFPEYYSRHEKRQSVAVTLGTSYDEWCLAQIANELGLKADYQHFLKHSYNYRNLFNPNTKFFHPKDSAGSFIEPFNYKFSGGPGNRMYYDEGNGWIYRWYVQHNIPDLISLMGGNEIFAENLDSMFSEPLGMAYKFQYYHKLGGDVTGNVGQFCMGNEPSFHIPYLYNYCGKPWKTQKRIRTLLKQWFRNDLMGLPGDEDGGAMSSFYVFSSMGFYPVTPGSPEYSIGSPLFRKTKIHLQNNKAFEIEAIHASEENKYIQSATFNGNPFNKPWISHEELVKGGKLVLEMGPKANKKWGIVSKK